MTALAPWPPEGRGDWVMLALQALLVASVALAGLVLAWGLAAT